MLEIILESLPAAKVIDGDGTYVRLDLSADNPGLPIDADARKWQHYIDDCCRANHAMVAYGGYLEKRNLYRRSTIFNDGDSKQRDVHIGIDLWTNAGTKVFAALAGKVHSFDYNTGLGNYGPTIILEHELSGRRFYSLYGHLSLSSIEEIEIGDVFNAGEQMAMLGDASVNGDYAPHLHFQIIHDIENNFGDYPGVCSHEDLPYYIKNCPDPNLLLKLK